MPAPIRNRTASRRASNHLALLLALVLGLTSAGVEAAGERRDTAHGPKATERQSPPRILPGHEAAYREATRALRGKGPKRILLVGPEGVGKTEVINALMAALETKLGRKPRGMVAADPDDAAKMTARLAPGANPMIERLRHTIAQNERQMTNALEQARRQVAARVPPAEQANALRRIEHQLRASVGEEIDRQKAMLEHLESDGDDADEKPDLIAIPSLERAAPALPPSDHPQLAMMTTQVETDIDIFAKALEALPAEAAVIAEARSLEGVAKRVQQKFDLIIKVQPPSRETIAGIVSRYLAERGRGIEGNEAVFQTTVARKLHGLVPATINEVLLRAAQHADNRTAESSSEDRAAALNLADVEWALELLRQQETSTVDIYRRKVADADLSPAAQRQAEQTLAQLARTNPASPEYSGLLSHLDWVIGLRWNTTTTDNLDPRHARAVLDADHHGLENVKDRIAEILAVKALRLQRGQSDGKARDILLFVGPPGTGKSSVAESIAKALGRSFVRISLGGIRDEAEIRGHRRTYVGALPGRIVRALSEAQSMNPVVLLDEVDKLGKDGFHGDPAAALLEVLDPKQNHDYRDHYLGLPLDLSQVLFVVTANDLSTIPPALRDRMEVIELDGYAEEEKLPIAEKHLVPRALAAAALNEGELKFNDAALRHIIDAHTRGEAGVRQLEQQISKIARGAAAKIAKGELSGPIAIHTAAAVDGYLGPGRPQSDLEFRITGPGQAAGLAVSGASGDVLSIEVATIPGRTGRLRFTGQLQDVMKESAEIAATVVQANAKAFGITWPAKTDIHIHAPAGAIPKNGPSAGVALVTALVSKLSERRVRSDVAMTGEVTVTGKVLPVGGIKPKLMGAFRRGKTTVVIPKANEGDLAELPAAVRAKLTVHAIEDVADAVKIALEPATPAPQS